MIEIISFLEITILLIDSLFILDVLGAEKIVIHGVPDLFFHSHFLSSLLKTFMTYSDDLRVLCPLGLSSYSALPVEEVRHKEP